MAQLTIGLLIADEALLAETRRALSGLPVRLLFEQKDVSDWTAVGEKLDRLRPAIVMAEYAQVKSNLEDVVRGIRRAPGAPAVIIVHTDADTATVLRALRAGAAEYLNPPLPEALAAALQRIGAERMPIHTSVTRGRTFAFFSAKGGCGATTVACHFALALQRQSQKEVLLADFDLDAGIIGFLLKSKSPYSILDAAGNLNRLDFSYWKALISNGIPGIEVIKAPAATGTRSSCDPASLRHILAFVRCHYDYVVADLGRSLSAVAMNCLEEVDTGVVVTTPDVPSLHYAQHIARVLKDAGCGEEKIRLVLNRVNKRMEITREEIEQLVNLPLAAVLPEDYQALYDAYAGGELMPPETALSRHIAELAGKLGGFKVERKTRKFGLFG